MKRRIFYLGLLLALLTVGPPAAGPMEDLGFRGIGPSSGLPQGAWAWETCDGWQTAHVPVATAWEIWPGYWIWVEAGNHQWFPGTWWRKVQGIPGFWDYGPWCSWLMDGSRQLVWGSNGWLVSLGSADFNYNYVAGLLNFNESRAYGFEPVAPYIEPFAGGVVTDWIWGSAGNLRIITMPDHSEWLHAQREGSVAMIARAQVPPVATDVTAPSAADSALFAEAIASGALTRLRTLYKVLLTERRAGIPSASPQAEIILERELVTDSYWRVRDLAAKYPTSASIQGSLSRITVTREQAAQVVGEILNLNLPDRRNHLEYDVPWIEALHIPVAPPTLVEVSAPNPPPDPTTREQAMKNLRAYRQFLVQQQTGAYLVYLSTLTGITPVIYPHSVRVNIGRPIVEAALENGIPDHEVYESLQGMPPGLLQELGLTVLPQ